MKKKRMKGKGEEKQKIEIRREGEKGKTEPRK